MHSGNKETKERYLENFSGLLFGFGIPENKARNFTQNLNASILIIALKIQRLLGAEPNAMEKEPD